jgi:hypothetical protein
MPATYIDVSPKLRAPDDNSPKENCMKKTITMTASAALIAMFGALSAGAAQAADNSKANASCRQETKRVAVWPRGPKAQRVARFEDREVTICDGKVVSSRKPDSTEQSNRSGD